MVNLWAPYAELLVPAFASGDGSMGAAMVLEGIRPSLPAPPANVLDVGGGFGWLALALAQEGHTVTVLDIDPRSLEIVAERLAEHPASIQERVALRLGDGVDADAVAGEGAFDLVCCHSVLMYETAPERLVASLVRATRPGGLLSVSTVNPAAAAMRPALQGRWEVAAATLRAGRDMDPTCLPTVQHSREAVVALLADAGATLERWCGLGVFTDHDASPVSGAAVLALLESERLAGARDPYRQVARCFHLIARRDVEVDPAHC